MSTAEAQKAAVEKLRSQFLNAPKLSMLQTQELTARGPRVKDPFHVEQVSVAAPSEPDLLEALWQVVSNLQTVGEKIERPQYARDLGGEWTYPQQRGDLSQAPVILYFHGGSYNSGSPTAARPAIANLCKRNGFRAFAPKYRLGPQSVFPEQVLDALVAYFFLIAPPSGANYQPVMPYNIVFVGESAGASLALAAIQVLLHLRREQPGYASTLPFHGHETPINLPAGCAILSVVGDWTFSLPSNTRHSKTDFLLGEPWLQPDFPVDSVWPTDPPRGEAFCYPEALCHPLISPTLCRDWTGAPPMWICSGEEVLADSMMLIAQTAARQGVSVEVSQYEGMPHVFPLSVGKLPQAAHSYDRWAAACKTFVSGGQVDKNATFFSLGDLKPCELDVRNLITLTHEEAFEMMKVGRARKTKDVFTGSHNHRPSRM